MMIHAVRWTGWFFLLSLLLLAPVPGSGQDTTSVQSPGRSGLCVGIAPAGELRRYSITQEVFVGTPDCGLFETGNSEGFGLALDLLLPVGRKDRSGPGLSLMMSLVSSRSQVMAPQNYTFTALRSGERSLVEIPHSYHLESRAIEIGTDLFWDLSLPGNLSLRAGLGASFSMPGTTDAFDRVEDEVYRFEDGRRERSLTVAGPGFPSLLIGPLLGLGYRIETAKGVTIDPGITARLGIDPDNGSLVAVAIGARLGIRVPIREPLDPLAATLAIGDRDRPRSGLEPEGLHLVVVDSYEKDESEEWKMSRVVDPPTMTVGPRWQGAPGGRVEAWSIVIRQGEGVLLSADSDDRSPPERIDWKLPARGRTDTVIGLRAELHVRDSLGRDARAVELLPLHIRHLVRFTAQSGGGEVHLLSIPDSALLALRGVAPTLAGAVVDRLGPADTLYYLSTRPEQRERDSIRVDHLIAVLRPDRTMRPQLRSLIGRGEELIRLFDREDLPEAGIILLSPIRRPERSTTPE